MNDDGANTSQTILMVKFHINSQIYYHHKIQTAYSRNMKICNLTELGVLNPNMWLEILYQVIFKLSKNRLSVEKVYSERKNCQANLLSVLEVVIFGSNIKTIGGLE